MNKKTQKKYVALLTLLAMVICTMFCTNTAKADTDLPWETSEVKKVSKCTINGIERTLTLLKKGRKTQEGKWILKESQKHLQYLHLLRAQ